MSDEQIKQVVEQMLQAYEQQNWYLVAVDAVMILLFAISMFYSVYAKVQSVKLKRENAKLMKEQAANDSEKAKLEIQLRQEYANDMKTLSNNVLGKVAENEAKREAEAQARANEINAKLKETNKSLDDILGDN